MTENSLDYSTNRKHAVYNLDETELAHPSQFSE